MQNIVQTLHCKQHPFDEFNYAAILSGKNDHSLWSLSTAEQFVSSFLTSARSDFTSTQNAQGLNRT